MATDLWWLTDERLNQTGANGISINGCSNITIRDCVIHNWPGSGINENYSEYVKVEGNIIANNARWSVGGVHGCANSKPGTGQRVNEDALKMLMSGNLVSGSHQCIPSRVTAKGFADLKLDEGGGLHTQAQPQVTAEGGVVFGRWEVSNNLVLYCGKSGINQNCTGQLTIERNSLYCNGLNTGASDIHLAPPGEDDPTFLTGTAIVKNNIIHSIPSGMSVNRLGVAAKKYDGVGENYVAAGIPGNTDYVANTPIKGVVAVFRDPANGDFRRHPDVPVGNGAEDATVEALLQKAKDYGIELKPCPVITDEAYLNQVKKRIFDNWPDPATIPAFGAGFVLHDGEEHYTYEQRAEYPRATV
jgi:hypothetical protein